MQAKSSGRCWPSHRIRRGILGELHLLYHQSVMVKYADDSPIYLLVDSGHVAKATLELSKIRNWAI